MHLKAYSITSMEATDKPTEVFHFTVKGTVTLTVEATSEEEAIAIVAKQKVKAFTADHYQWLPTEGATIAHSLLVNAELYKAALVKPKAFKYKSSSRYNSVPPKVHSPHPVRGV